MIKEIAKKIFFHNLSDCSEDINLMAAHANIERFFLSCTKELSYMSNFKFYSFYSYFSVLKMSKKIKKLSNLTRNEIFEKNLKSFNFYKNDLQQIWMKALRVRDDLLIIETKLKIFFGNFFPDVVYRKLMNNLSIEDLLL